MKIRQGFVSNSSSSSFIVGYGVIDKKRKGSVIDMLDSIEGVYYDDWYSIRKVSELKMIDGARN